MLKNLLTTYDFKSAGTPDGLYATMKNATCETSVNYLIIVPSAALTVHFPACQ